MLFGVYLSNNFAFDQYAALQRDTTCMDEWVAEFPENILNSAPNSSCGWVPCVFL